MFVASCAVLLRLIDPRSHIVSVHLFPLALQRSKANFGGPHDEATLFYSPSDLLKDKSLRPR